MNTTENILTNFDRLFEKSKLWAMQRFMGVQTQQNPFDAWIIQEILWDTRPQLVIETGTQNGGGAVYYAAMMSLYDQNAKVMTIDTRPVDETKQLYSIPGFCTRMKCTNATDNLFWSRNIEFVQGDSLSTFVRSKVNRAVRDASSVMVILDSWHGFSHVLNELNVYSEFVSDGNYLVVQDTKLDRLRSKPGPKAAVRSFMKPNGKGFKKFTVDRSREYLLYTQHSEGYLKRK